MGKGLLILLGTIIVVAIFHLVTMKITKISEAKKTHYRKFFCYFYGITFMLSGGINLLEKGEYGWSFLIQFLVGLVTVILNFTGKMEQKTS
ncbi:hypothetical protein N9Y20_00775 [Flavobacteriaceae bacterium]|nr:hypothetical protein [Flavobacteriaceae bacterium]MDA9584775.1 hypothetical protein [Flavobacteriaceae bacterium]MDB2632802.1 hypothetical protein [Flavobacteriaceae bacterium]MDB4256581.1 hypothetical protein [Flavobacteriaceae bacterium]MDC0330858.1 hypothetical protein [Flavobacteriaceae bacterium]